MRNVSSKEIIIVLGIVAAVLLAGFVAQQHSAPAEAADAGPFAITDPDKAQTAPDFTLQTTDGRSIKLSQAIANGPVVLDFWATWCKPCNMELPILDNDYRKFSARGVQFYGINSDETASQIKYFFRNQSVGFPILVDSGGLVGAAYGVTGLPSVVVVDRDGKARAVDVGFDPDTDHDLTNCLNTLLEE